MLSTADALFLHLRAVDFVSYQDVIELGITDDDIMSLIDSGQVVLSMTHAGPMLALSRPSKVELTNEEITFTRPPGV